MKIKLAQVKLKGVSLNETDNLKEFINTIKSDGAIVTIKVLRKGLIHIKASQPKVRKRDLVKKKKRKPGDPDVTASLLPQLFNL